MPYIRKEKREDLDAMGLETVARAVETTGDLNYVISYLANHMVKALPKKSYTGMSAIGDCASDG